MKWYYPAGFLFATIAGIIYYLIPDKSNYLADVTNSNLRIIAVATFLLIILQFLVAKKVHLKSPLGSQNKRRVILILTFYALVAAIIQEFMYRTFLYDITKYIFPAQHFLSFLIFSSFLFSITHMTYRDRFFFASSSLLGIFLSVVYIFVPNLMVVATVHAILGSAGILSGYVREEGRPVLL